MRRMLLLGSTLLLLLGCSESPTDSEEALVTLLVNSFSPDDLEVDAGTEVTWVNANSIEHTITPLSHTQWERTEMNTSGQRYSVRLDAPGVFNYECELHPGMTGTITVNP